MTALETCQYIEKMVSLVPYQFEPESDETVEVADRQETDSQARTGAWRFSVVSVKC